MARTRNTPRKRREEVRTFDCPHCHETLELLSQNELTKEYDLGPNPVAHRRQQGVFPEPALEFVNRTLWLRADIERYLEEGRRERAAQLVERLDQEIAALPDREREEVLKKLTDGGLRRSRKRAESNK